MQAGYTSDIMQRFCAFAADNSNTQTKYLIYGSKSLWPAEQHRLDPDMDATLLAKARGVLEQMYMVGRSDQLDEYLLQLRATLGLPHRKLAAPSQGWGSGAGPSKNWTAASQNEWQCLDKGASVDDQLFTTYCPQER